MQARAVNVAVSLVYLAAFLHIYEAYLSKAHAYTGLYYAPFAVWELAFVFACTAIVSAFLPLQLNRPSGITLWLMHVFVVVPALAMSFMIGSAASTHYIAPLLTLCAAMIINLVVAQLPLRGEPTEPFVPDRRMTAFFLAAWALVTVVLVVRFASIMSFAGIDDIYYQRSLASDRGFDGAISYARTYYTYVLSPALIILGLMRRQWLVVGLGVAGQIISYTIDASKISLILPMVIFGVYFAQSRGFRSTYLYTGALAGLVGVCSMLTDRSALIRYMVDVMVLRSIAIPGQTFTQYYDLFSAKGYTWWSHVRGLNLFIPPPASFANDGDWPVLGVIVGRYFYTWTADVNVNANPFSGEGVAAAGPLGVLVIGVVMAAWLRFFDYTSRGWNTMFTVMAVTPTAMALTNAHLSTVLVSFGGAFWTLMLMFYRPLPAARPRGLPRVAKARSR